MKRDKPKGIGEAIFSPQKHPLAWLDYFNIPAPYDWQREIIVNAAMPHSRCAVSTCNESGKTAVIIPALGLSIMVAFPGATIFSTAGSEEQVRGQLMKYLEAKLRPYSGKKDGWEIVESDMVVKGPRVNGFRSRWVARCPKDALTVEGYHSRWERGDDGEWYWLPICVIYDEAKSIGRDMFEAAWRIDPDFFIVISTPGEDSGPFYESLEEVIKSGKAGGHRDSKDKLWKYRRQVSWKEVPHLRTPEKLAIREALTRKYGENSSFIKSFLGGEFKRDSDENYVFTDHDVEKIRDCMTDKYHHVPGRLMAALDFSGGGDEQVIYIADGNKVIFSEFYREEDTAKLASVFVDLLKNYNVEPHNCMADNGGIGLAIIDGMEAMGYRPVNRYMNNQISMNKTEFADRITEDHYRFKDKVHASKIILPNDPKLLKQIRQRKAYPDEHNRVKLEVKKKHRVRTGESPDRLDAIIMLFAEWSAPKPKETAEPEYKSMLLATAQARSGVGGGAFPWIKDHKQKELSSQVITAMSKIRR